MPLTPFQLALQQGMESKEKVSPIRNALKPLGEKFKITAAEDAHALAAALISAAEKNPDHKLGSVFTALVHLLQNIGSREAFQVLQTEAMPCLEKLFDQEFATGKPDAHKLHFILKLFALYGRAEGFQRVVRAIRGNLAAVGGGRRLLAVSMPSIPF